MMKEADEREELGKEPSQPVEDGRTAKDIEEAGPQVTTDGAIAVPTAAGARQPNLIDNIENSEAVPDEKAALEQSQPGTGEDINFDSMLNNPEGSPNEFDLHLNFSSDDVGHHNFLSSHNFVNLGAENNGLDSELPDTKTGGGQPYQQGEQQPDTQTNSNPEEVMAPGESSFDDLFMDNDNFEEGGTGDQGLLEGDHLMNMSELDDSWFTWGVYSVQYSLRCISSYLKYIISPSLSTPSRV